MRTPELLEHLLKAQHLRQQATRYRELAHTIENKHALRIILDMARDFDERAFDLIYGAQTTIRDKHRAA